MEIKLHEIAISEIIDGYTNNDEEGVVGFGGNLNIRPPYQREFIYGDKDRNAVIKSILANYPLNVMYWVHSQDLRHLEVLDGQQRLISICEYCAGNFSIPYQIREGMKPHYFHSLPKNVQDQILDYKLMVYYCNGKPIEQIEWFETINIVGAKLTKQELRNAVYAGSWTADAKLYFSKTNCPARSIGSKYLSGSPIRQEYLETAISWISQNKIEEYMDEHKNDPDAEALWEYFESVIEWIQSVFPKYRNPMKGINWGDLYSNYKDKKLDPDKLESQIKVLMLDDDVENKKGIYHFVLSGDESKLGIRLFSEVMRIETYEKQDGFCVKCKESKDLKDMEAHHMYTMEGRW